MFCFFFFSLNRVFFFLLLVDSNDEVEKTCHRVIVDMESTLGESLQDYFNN